jgi:uncharacterized protein
MQMAHSLAKNAGAKKLLVKSKPAFLVDSMLGSVARKLRFFGFDTVYVVKSPDDEIISFGLKDNRFILTCDEDMYKRIVKARAQGTLLKGSDDFEDISRTFQTYGALLGEYMEVNSRCSMCNGLLAERSHVEITKKINTEIKNRQKQFFECKRCYKVYWEGSHFTDLMELSKRIDNRILEQLEQTVNSLSFPSPSSKNSSVSRQKRR